MHFLETCALQNVWEHSYSSLHFRKLRIEIYQMLNRLGWLQQCCQFGEFFNLKYLTLVKNKHFRFIWTFQGYIRIILLIKCWNYCLSIFFTHIVNAKFYSKILCLNRQFAILFKLYKNWSLEMINDRHSVIK